jgi:SAM-dependent methyltransferase
MNSEQQSWLRTMRSRRVFADAARTHDMFAHAQSEMTNYLSTAGHRFLRTLELVKRVTPAGARVLEIGANPYFVTAVLLQNFKLDATSMGRPPEVWPGSPLSLTKQERYLEVEGDSFRLEEVVCNAEKDRFPVDSAAFDLVIAAEILEHLIFSPTHFLCEIHRVLKPGGHLILTTPNASQLRYLFKWIAGRHSVWDQYSGYGVYGRHQREYTAHEVEELLRSTNFTVASTERYYSQPLNGKLDTKMMKLVYAGLRSRAPEMTFLARATGETKVCYPEFLYRSLYPVPNSVDEMIAFGNQDAGAVRRVRAAQERATK